MTTRRFSARYALLTTLVTLAFFMAACSGLGGSPEVMETPSMPVYPAANAVIPTANPASPAYPPVAVAPILSAPGSGSAYPAPAVAGDPTNKTAFHIVPGESTVTYEVNETLFREGNVLNTAVGVTDQISGTIYIDYTNPQTSWITPITVDINRFTSDSDRRDNTIRERFLESNLYPQAVFTATNITGLPASGQEGVDYPLQITGDLSVHGVTQPVAFTATLRLDGATLTGSATTTILMSDFGVGPISMAGILETQDEVRLTFKIVAR